MDNPELRHGATWEAVEVSGECDGDGADDLEIIESVLTSVRLTGRRLVRPRITDCRFERCELSGAVFEDAVLERVEFVDCRLSGAVLSEARLRNVRFSGCRLDAASFRMATAKSVVFERSQLPAADLYSVDLTGCEVIDCDLTGSDLSQAELGGARLHGSDLTDLVGGSRLRNIEIDAGQLIPIALLVFEGLGIRVTER